MENHTVYTEYFTRTALMFVFAIGFSNAASAQAAVPAASADTTVYAMDKVQKKPEFPGGESSFLIFISRFQYPQAALNNQVSGIASIGFVIEKDGTLSNFKIVNDLGYGTSQEAIRLLKTSPKWKPGINNGRPVRVAITQPIALKVQ